MPGCFSRLSVCSGHVPRVLGSSPTWGSLLSQGACFSLTTLIVSSLSQKQINKILKNKKTIFFIMFSKLSMLVHRFLSLVCLKKKKKKALWFCVYLVWPPYLSLLLVLPPTPLIIMGFYEHSHTDSNNAIWA